MKRTLSLVLALVMVLGSFSAVFAAEQTVEEKAAAFLKEQGVLAGDASGDLMLEKGLLRQDAVILLSKLMGDFETAKEFPTSETSPSYEDIADDFYLPFLAWAQANKTFVGHSNAKFGFGDNLTTQEYASVLLRVLGYEVEWTETLAKAEELGLLADIEADADFLRGNMAVMTLNALGTEMKDSTVTLAEKLEIEMPVAPTPEVVDATKVESVTASNLVEVVIQFDGKVDPATAEDESNYVITGKAISSAILSEDETAVTLIVDTTGANTALTNQTEYKLSFNNVRSAGKVLSATNHKFTPVDAQLPSVVAVEALGNKTVKVTFTEPVQNPATGSFLIDGKTVLGYANTVGRVVTIRLYSPLANGEHTINVKNVADFFNLKSLSQDVTFTVVEDTTAPTVAEVVRTTFEAVTIRFSEPVDPATVIGSNVYWMQGTSKKVAAYNVIRKADDTYEFDFTSNNIQYTTDLYITGVKDYSGNTIAADTKVSVTPVVDTNRPEVINTVQDSLSQITVKFTKTLDLTSAQKPSNYVIKDANGKEVSKVKTPVLQPDNRTVVITLAQALSEGKTYTLEIAGVSDTTILKNVMMPYSTQLSTEDETAPTVSGITYNTVNNSIIVTFDEQMAVSGDGSIVEPSKYLYFVGTWKSLPGSAIINVTADGKSVIITFPSTIAVNTITNFRVQLVKDLADNYLSGLTYDHGAILSASNPTASSAKATATNKIQVNFTEALQANTVNANDFIVTNAGGTVLNVVAAELHSTVASRVILTLADNTKLTEDALYTTTVTVTVKANATTSTAAGKTIAVSSQTVADGIKTTLDTIVGSADGNTMTLTFNEAVASSGSLTNDATDLVITDKNGAVLNPATDYSITFPVVPASNQLLITFTTPQSGVMTVAIANPRFITDGASPANVVAAQEAISVQVDNAAPTFTALAAYATDVITVTASEDLQAVTATNLKVEGSVLGTFADTVVLVAGTDYTAALNAGDAKLIEVTLTAAGKAKVAPVATTKFKVTGLSSVKDLAGHSVSTTLNVAEVVVAAY